MLYVLAGTAGLFIGHWITAFIDRRMIRAQSDLINEQNALMSSIQEASEDLAAIAYVREGARFVKVAK